MNFFSVFFIKYGGGRGIRTPVTLPPNGFQDRPVMTTSVSLRVVNVGNNLSTKIIIPDVNLFSKSEIKFFLFFLKPLKNRLYT